MGWIVQRRGRRIWAKAHARAKLLRSRRDDLRETLSHLGLAIVFTDDTFILDIRRQAGACWFDRHYNHLMGRP